mmetsp:Transcript_2367/g.4106  ORF Transcript_2367/g.4106 Transcript_2367/m.4106 type:complete len:360 (-) Transcript_2367:28-1107(-)
MAPHATRATRATLPVVAASLAALVAVRFDAGLRFAVLTPEAQDAEADFSQMTGPGILHEMIGEYALPKPVVLSPHGQLRVQEDLGVNVTMVGDDAYIVSPQHWSNYRPLGLVEETYLRDMEGETVSHEDNPGIRVEPDFVSEAEEDHIMAELIELASTFGYDFAAEEEAAAASWRMTGRDEKKTDLPLAPWGWGKDFHESQLPSGLRLVVEKLQSLPGYPLGPIRDVTVNIRSSDDYQMVPHVDPLLDGPNSFVLSLLSSAVVTFSPIATLRTEIERANDDEQYAQHSYTDDDIDCLVPRRAIYHFAGNARYLWTHAVRPSVTAGDGTDGTFERWGTWDKVLRRGKNRAAIIFTFADPM